MCTAVAYQTDHFYFGRTLDYHHSFGEEVVITPRSFPIQYKQYVHQNSHYAIIGMAHISQNYPLYYDAMNEKGLCMAGLNFVGNAYFHDISKRKNNIAPHEFILWILSQCANLKEARQYLNNMNLISLPFSDEFPIAMLHWIISDHTGSVVVESMEDGLHIYDNSVGILTNNPPYPIQQFSLNPFISLSPQNPPNNFLSTLKLPPYSLGLGSFGLPGDYTSQSRFIRAAFVKANSVSSPGEINSVNQFFHILNSVAQPRGCCQVNPKEYEITLYSSCCSAEKGIYYYTTYNNHQINAVRLFSSDYRSERLIHYPINHTEQIFFQN